mmetsp:Transcript_99135/g.229636  ORF Transcript_99135/g.229636 Transcript_99135/m.229636 type:complete len:98 (-) Transcript_99135:294-587(-)
MIELTDALLTTESLPVEGALRNGVDIVTRWRLPGSPVGGGMAIASTLEGAGALLAVPEAAEGAVSSRLPEKLLLLLLSLAAQLLTTCRQLATSAELL